MRPGGTLTAGGQAIHVGRSVGLSEAFVLDADSERLLAHGTSRLTIFRPLDPPPEPPEELSSRWNPRAHETPDPYLRPPPDGVIEQAVWDELSGMPRSCAASSPASSPPRRCPSPRPGMHPTDELGEGKATVVMPASEWLASPTGLLQGGAIAMLADFAMLIAVETTTPAGLAFAALDLKVNFLRPVPPDGAD